MPLEGAHATDVGMELAEGFVCKHDLENGVIKRPEVIFEGGVAFFAGVVGGDRDLARRLTRKNMRSLPYWQAHPFAELDGQEASTAELAQAMKNL